MTNVDANTIEFIVKYRMHLTIAVDKGRGTKYESLKEEIVDFMISRVYDYLSSVGRAQAFDTGVKKHMLRVIYTNFVQALLECLKRHKAVEDMIESYQCLLEYHYMGVDGFLKPNSPFGDFAGLDRETK